MTENHPITSPPELRRLWAEQARRMYSHDPVAWIEHVANQAARWGADQELEACVEWMRGSLTPFMPDQAADQLRAARRPKPPSLAEEGQRILVENGSTLDGRVELDPEDVATIRAALERLKELEKGDE